jgi:hypothetical protein
MNSIHNRLSTMRRDERGISTMLIGFGMVGFLGATVLALDVGWWLVARSMAQNSADAGALSGAVALVFNDYDDRSADGPAVTSALTAARANRVGRDEVFVGPEDVTFPLGPTGLNNRVGVEVERPIPTVLASVFGMDSMLSKARAVAEASPANAMRCLLPFMIPDKWTERTDPPFDEESFFEMYDNRGRPLNPADEYRKGVGGTGYNPYDDKGDPIILKTDNTSRVSPGVYNPWAIPGSTGADDYRAAIAGCRTGSMETDQDLTLEPGNMVGPTRQGIEELIAKDPRARWSDACNCVVDSDPRYSISPRIRPIPLYDPVYYEQNKQTGRNAAFKMVSFLGVFVERMQGNEVIARIHPISGEATGNPTTASPFAMAIRLVE